MDNKSFCKSVTSSSLLSKNKNKFTAAILLTTVSCDKIINHKSLGDIWHIAGYEFRELHHTAKQNKISLFIKIRIHTWVPIKIVNRNKTNAIFCLINAVNNIYP